MHQLQTISRHQPAEDSLLLPTTRKSLIELLQPPKSTVPTRSKTQSLPKTMVIRYSEQPTKTLNRQKLSSLQTTKHSTSMNELDGTVEPMPMVTDQLIVIPERVDSRNSESDEDRKNDEHLLP